MVPVANSLSHPTRSTRIAFFCTRLIHNKNQPNKSSGSGGPQCPKVTQALMASLGPGWVLFSLSAGWKMFVYCHDNGQWCAELGILAPGVTGGQSAGQCCVLALLPVGFIDQAFHPTNHELQIQLKNMLKWLDMILNNKKGRSKQIYIITLEMLSLLPI